ncbi:hypothetical protein ACWD5R_44075 [Streptomyces sp. NPDC002514]|uniref:hypothetical protein n=1 Tax=Streptomyces sp. NPDC001270 TaxID=3364554 RepID=UPI0036A086A0
MGPVYYLAGAFERYDAESWFQRIVQGLSFSPADSMSLSVSKAGREVTVVDIAVSFSEFSSGEPHASLPLNRASVTVGGAEECGVRVALVLAPNCVDRTAMGCLGLKTPSRIRSDRGDERSRSGYNGSYHFWFHVE